MRTIAADTAPLQHFRAIDTSTTCRTCCCSGSRARHVERPCVGSGHCSCFHGHASFPARAQAFRIHAVSRTSSVLLSPASLESCHLGMCPDLRCQMIYSGTLHDARGLGDGMGACFVCAFHGVSRPIIQLGDSVGRALGFFFAACAIAVRSHL